MQKREKNDIKRVQEMKVRGKRNRGRRKYRWQDTIRKDLQSCTLNEQDAQGMVRWRSL